MPKTPISSGHSDEKDGVFVDADGYIPSFRNPESLLRFAAACDLPVEAEEPILLNLDILKQWFEEKDDRSIECNVFNGAWNLFADVSRSLGDSFDADEKLTRRIYNKLFWGCNLPSVRPEGEVYHPWWSGRELRIMGDVLRFGIEIFKSKIRSC